MSKPRYYTDEQQILAAIDRTQKRIAMRNNAALMWERRFSEVIRSGGPRHQMNIARDNADHYFQLAYRIETTTLRKLKKKLAEFRTIPIEGIGRLEVRVK